MSVWRDDHPPVQFLNYKGDVRGSIGRVMGPMLGSAQMLTVVEEQYWPDEDRTRLGLAYGVLDMTDEAAEG